MAIYMKYGTFKGDVTVKGYEGWIELESFSWGLHRNINAPKSGGANRESGEPIVGEIHVTKKTDMATISLFGDAIASKSSDTKVNLHFTQTNKQQTPFLKIDLENTVLSSFQITASSEHRPMESLTLNFTKIVKTHTPIMENGQGTPKSGGYDLTKMTPT